MLHTCCVFVSLCMLDKTLGFRQCNAEMACASNYAESAMPIAIESNWFNAEPEMITVIMQAVRVLKSSLPNVLCTLYHTECQTEY